MCLMVQQRGLLHFLHGEQSRLARGHCDVGKRDRRESVVRKLLAGAWGSHRHVARWIVLGQPWPCGVLDCSEANKPVVAAKDEAYVASETRLEALLPGLFGELGANIDKERTRNILAVASHPSLNVAAMRPVVREWASSALALLAVVCTRSALVTARNVLSDVGERTRLARYACPPSRCPRPWQADYAKRRHSSAHHESSSRSACDKLVGRARGSLASPE